MDGPTQLAAYDRTGVALANIVSGLTCVKPRATVDSYSQRLITVSVMRPKRGVEVSGRQCGEL
jgi:hypothetical protein